MTWSEDRNATTVDGTVVEPLALVGIRSEIARVGQAESPIGVAELRREVETMWRKGLHSLQAAAVHTIVDLAIAPEACALEELDDGRDRGCDEGDGDESAAGDADVVEGLDEPGGSLERGDVSRRHSRGKRAGRKHRSRQSMA